jgi:hypothetical protein
MKRNALGVTLLKCLLLLLIHEAFSPALNSNAAQLEAADTTPIHTMLASAARTVWQAPRQLAGILHAICNHFAGREDKVWRGRKRQRQAAYVRFGLERTPLLSQ